MKELKQSKKARAKFLAKNKEFVNYVIEEKQGKFFIEDIQKFFNTDNRSARKKISELALFYPIVSLSNERGYEILPSLTNIDPNKVDELAFKCQHQINDIESRKKALSRREKPLIAWLKTIERMAIK